MSVISTALDQFATVLNTALGLPVTRDPSALTAPCVFIGGPSVAGRTAGAVILEVPVHLVADSGIADAIASEWLYDHLEAFIVAAGLAAAEPRTLNVQGYDNPTYFGTSTLTVRST